MYCPNCGREIAIDAKDLKMILAAKSIDVTSSNEDDRKYAETLMHYGVIFVAIAVFAFLIIGIIFK